MSKEGPRRQRTGEIHYLAMHTQMQEKDSDFPGGTNLAMHALDVKESRPADSGVLCAAQQTCREAVRKCLLLIWLERMRRKI